MNTSGCPIDFATDGAFQAPRVGDCETSLVGFYVFTLSISSIKLVSAGKQFRNWKSRPTHQTMIPRGPINAFAFGLVLLMEAVLIGFNVINFANGLSFCLFSISFLQFAWTYSVGVKRIVQLGEKILPKSTRGTSGAASLATFDGVGKVFFAVQVVSICVSSLVLIVLSPILTGNEDVVSRFGFGTKGLFMFFCIAGYINQFERCIKTIRGIQRDTRSIRIPDRTTAGADDLGLVIRKMRVNQCVHIFGGGPTALIFILLAAGVLPANVFVVFSVALAEALSSVVYEFGVKAKSSPAEGGSKTMSSSTNGHVAPALLIANTQIVAVAAAVVVDDNGSVNTDTDI